MKFISISVSLLTLELGAFASLPFFSTQTCQFPASFLTYIDQNIDHPNAIVAPDPELSFFKDIMKFRDDDIQHTADDAVKFFNKRYGLDFSLSPPNDNIVSFYENATLKPFKLAIDIDFIVMLSNWIQTGSTQSKCYQIYEGGFEVAFSGTQILHGSYGGVDGELVGERDLLLYGFLSIDVCPQSPVIILFQSATPVRQVPVDNLIYFNNELYNRVLGYGKSLGFTTLTPALDEPGRFRLVSRSIYTFSD